MTYMLDTSVCIALMRNDDDAWDVVSSRGLDALCISTITVHELAYGPANTPDLDLRDKRSQALEDFLSAIKIQNFDATAASTAADIRVALKQTSIGYADTLIAGHALALDLTVVTRNERHFGRVDQLTVERW